MHIYNTPSPITAFATTRDGGVSFPAAARLFLPHHQVHGTATRIIDEAFLQKNALEQTLLLDGVDALCTNLPNVCVCVKTADCIPVLLYDEASRVISAVHAGWKGTLRRIVEHNIDTLQQTYGVNPANLHAIIGPGIGPESFEVGDEVYALFQENGFDMSLLAKRYPSMRLADKVPEHWHIDLWECNRQQLVGKGVSASNIQIAGIDTFVRYQQFFSARRHGEGRIINGVFQSYFDL